MAAFEASVMTILAPSPKYSAIAAWAIVSLEAVSRSSMLKLRGCFIFAAFTALLTSSTASSTAEIQSLLALGPVRGNIAPATMETAGTVGSELLLPQPPKATGTSSDRAAAIIETFFVTWAGANADFWLMPSQIGTALLLLERKLNKNASALARALEALRLRSPRTAEPPDARARVAPPHI